MPYDVRLPEAWSPAVQAVQVGRDYPSLRGRSPTSWLFGRCRSLARVLDEFLGDKCLADLPADRGLGVHGGGQRVASLCRHSGGADKVREHQVAALGERADLLAGHPTDPGAHGVQVLLGAFRLAD